MFCAAAKNTSLKPFSLVFSVQTVLPDCCGKNTFSAHFRVEIANQKFNIGSGASLIEHFDFAVKTILGCVILMVRRRMNTYMTNIKIFSLYADDG